MADRIARVWNGSSWEVITSTAAAPTAVANYQSAAPSSPVTGQVWVDSDDNQFYIWNGSSWIQSSLDLSAYLTQSSASSTYAPLSSPTFTGSISVPDGSVSSPSITNTGDTNTGVFFPSADTLAFSSGGTEAMRVNSSGVVTTPSRPVFVARVNQGSIGSTRIMPYSVAVINVGNCYNTTNYRFTAPVAGKYFFTIYDIGQANTTTRFRLRKNGSSTMGTLTHQLRVPSGGDYGSGLSNWLVEAVANDYFDVEIYAGTSYGTNEYAWFQGFLIG